jgi:hypothetical protein
MYRGIVVPPGGQCTVVDARIAGDVTAENGATLLAVSVRVSGNVVGDHALVVQTVSSTVHGAIDITGAGDSPTGITEVFLGENKVIHGISVVDSAGTMIVDRNTVKSGDITVTDNFVPPFLAFPSQLSVRFNTVSGNVTVSRNTGPSLKEVFSNEVARVLTCEDNDPPFTGGPNDARAYIGQCF